MHGDDLLIDIASI